MPKPTNSGPPAENTRSRIEFSTPKPAVTTQPRGSPGLGSWALPWGKPTTPGAGEARQELLQVPPPSADRSPASDSASTQEDSSPATASRSPSPPVSIHELPAADHAPHLQALPQLEDKMDIAISPPTFTGDGTQNPTSWWETFTNFCAFKSLQEAQLIGLFPLLLGPTASAWFNSLQNGQKDTTAHLKASFLAAFKPTASTLWSRERDLYSLKQLPTQTAVQFITSVQTATSQLDWDVEKTIRVAIGGLRPTIRTFVIQKEPATMAALIEAATVAEHSTSTDTGIDTLLTELQTIKQQMAELSAANTPPATIHQASFPPSSSGNSGSYLQRPSGSYQRPPSRFRPQSAPAQPRAITGKRDAIGEYPPCHSCGRNNHLRAQCRFKNVTCHFCHKKGHIQAVCRQAVRQSNASK